MPFARRPIRTLAALTGSVALAAAAQTSSRLPPTPPTSMVPPIAASPATGNTAQHHRARVSYEGGLLEVRADNSSLNQILRDISRQTGMKIVGGVADQRVFGNYGPAPAGTVLQTLLDGTGTNMLLQETPDHRPEQLVLSPRTGGATPPGPGSTTYDATETEPELTPPGTARPAIPPAAVGASAAPGTSPATAAAARPVSSQPTNSVFGSPNNVTPTASTMPVVNSVPLSTLSAPATAQPPRGIVDSPNPPPAGSTTAGYTSQTPPNANPNNAPATAAPENSVKTPQQIYEELKRLQQQNGSSQANPQGSSAPQ